MEGIGSQSCGQPPLPEYRLPCGPMKPPSGSRLSAGRWRAVNLLPDPAARFAVFTYRMEWYYGISIRARLQFHDRFALWHRGFRPESDSLPLMFI
jgi:hypothetical protein